MPGAVQSGLRQLLMSGYGLGILVLACGAWASLATWSVTDPSLNNATRTTPNNVLGHWGAGLADITFQSVGLASILLFLPLAAWGWHLIFGTVPNRRRSRLLAWPVSVVLLAGAFSALPQPKSWPLPSGLGGIIGEVLVAAAGIIGPFLPGAAISFVAGLGFLIFGTWLLLFACGTKLSNLIALWGPTASRTGEWANASLGAALHATMHTSAKVKRALTPKEPEWDEDEEEDEEPEWEEAPRGTRNALQRDASLHYDEVDEDDEKPVDILAAKARRAPPLPKAPGDPDGRIEPTFDLMGAGAYTEPAYEEDEDEDEEPPYVEERGYDDEDMDDDGSDDVTGVQITHRKEEEPKRRIAKRFPSMDTPYTPPALKLLQQRPRSAASNDLSDEELQENAAMLEGVLADFGVKGEIVNVRPGPVVTLYELEPAPGTKSSRVIGLAEDIARSMSAIAARVAVVPGRNAIGIELPNETRETVFLRELMESKDFQETDAKLALGLGKNIGGESVVVDLARMPHLLIAGTTGSGKSVGVNTMILSLLYRLSPDQCKFIMIDPKMLELSVYDGIPHLLAPVVTDPKKAVVALKWTVKEMEERYKRMSKLGVRDIKGYNKRVLQAEAKGEVLTRTVQTGFDRETGQAIYEQEEMDYDPMPYIVVIVDEMADLMMVAGKDIEAAVQRLAQMARAAGIHLITATQRPSVDVITGTIKANFPTRISFQVTSKIDSRTILGEQGAEQLLGQGDMLYMAGGGRVMRVHGPFVTDDEVEKVVRYLKKQGVPAYLDAVTDDSDADEDEDGDGAGSSGGSGPGNSNSGDELYDKAVDVVLRDKKASTSYVQRRLGIGYNKAATLIERMEEEGVISEANSSGKREILVGDEAEAPY
ncbi:DNA translocase FtsK [Methyloligella halotolerans]|uniref:DNA translocase FtsK n=1 Tax=Methyloligella halotolerans TaxID=1177755 RepID=A0A1E2S109_9HYPH|nr:DNA translocase FtsK [Methyloligella halotolerans]